MNNDVHERIGTFCDTCRNTVCRCSEIEDVRRQIRNQQNKIKGFRSEQESLQEAINRLTIDIESRKNIINGILGKNGGRKKN